MGEVSLEKMIKAKKLLDKHAVPKKEWQKQAMIVRDRIWRKDRGKLTKKEKEMICLKPQKK